MKDKKSRATTSYRYQRAKNPTVQGFYLCGCHRTKAIQKKSEEELERDTTGDSTVKRRENSLAPKEEVTNDVTGGKKNVAHKRNRRSEEKWLASAYYRRKKSRRWPRTEATKAISSNRNRH